MPLNSQKDFYAGTVFLLAGCAFAWGATDYQIGTAARMGPGYFPALLGAVLAILGGVMVARALAARAARPDKVGAWAWRPLVFVIAANVVFGVALGGLPTLGVPVLGLIAGIYLLTLMACLATDRFNAKEAALLATVLAVMSYLVFVMLLKLQFPVWPAFMTV